MIEMNKRNELPSEISKREIVQEITIIGAEGTNIGEEYSDRTDNAEIVADALKQLSDTVAEGRESRLFANRGYATESQKMADEGESDEQYFNQANEVPIDSLSDKIVIENENERILSDSLAHVHAAGFESSFINDKVSLTIENKQEFDANIKEIDSINKELNETNKNTFHRLNDAVNSLE